MRAVVIGGDGSLAVRDVVEPRPGPHDLLLAVGAAGVNRADLAQRAGRHDPAAAPPDPHVAGMDAAGTVVGMGPDVTGFRPGDRVMGLLAGGYAERALLDARVAVPVPEAWSLVEAAAAVAGLQTEYDALVNAARLERGETVVVHGGSTPVGLTGLQLARHLGAGLVVATIRTPRAHAEVVAAGAQVVVHTSEETLGDAVLAATDGRGADVIVDHVGGALLAECVRSLALGGRLVSVGRLAGATGELDLERLAYQRARIIGVTFRTRTVAQRAAIARGVARDLLPAMRQGALRPIVDRTYPLERAADAQARMAGDAHRGKLVLTVP